MSQLLTNIRCLAIAGYRVERYNRSESDSMFLIFVDDQLRLTQEFLSSMNNVPALSDAIALHTDLDNTALFKITNYNNLFLACIGPEDGGLINYLCVLAKGTEREKINA